MLDENMGAAHRGLPCSWPPGRPRCPSVPGRPLDDLYCTHRGEAYYHTDEGEVVRGGADQCREQEEGKEGKSYMYTEDSEGEDEKQKT